MNHQNIRLIEIATVSFSCFVSVAAQAQVVPDNSLPDNSVVTPNGNVIQINGGTTRGTNLFHSFQEFSVPAGNEAVFDNAEAIDNILSRVTGGAESIIDGGIGANGTANVFLINPAGIVFGENAFLNVGGSFIGSTADNLLFPDGIEYSATNLDSQPILTINAPIGLGFRENPGDITNSSIATDDTGEDLIGLRVFEDQTLALIGGNVFIDGGFLSTVGGRIEVGSVAANSNVSIAPVAQGFNFEYDEVSNFQNIELSFAAEISNFDPNAGDIELQGANISLVEGSTIGITADIAGQAGDINIVATESLTLDGNASEVLEQENFGTLIVSDISNNATGEGSRIDIDTPSLSITNGAQITTRNNLGDGKGVDIKIDAAEIVLGQPFFFSPDDFIPSGIVAQVFEEGTGNGGNIAISTDRLTFSDGAQIVTGTFGVGDGGSININATESIALNGTIADSSSPSAIFANVGIPNFPISTAGNSGDITIDTPRLRVRDGAQIGTSAQSDGNGGRLTINASESVLLSGISPLATLQSGRSGIFTNVQPAFIDEESGEIVPTTGNGGTLNLTTEEFIVEQGAIISANTFSEGQGGNANINVARLIVRDGSEIGAGSLIEQDSIDVEKNIQRGAGGTLNINASESIEVTGMENINGDTVNSSLFARAESTGNAGSISLNSNILSVNNGGLISAATAAGEGGNITLNIDRSISLSDDSLISAAATGDASGGNINIDTGFIIASPDGNNDIVASAGEQGTGGNINIDADSVFGLETRPQNDATNDIDATGGVDGQIIINTPDTDITQGVIEVPQNIVESERTVAQVCRNDDAVGNTLVVRGRGGIPPEPVVPLNSESLLIDDDAAAQPPKALLTSVGEIMPARGLIKTASGKIILTAYPTVNNRRVTQGNVNCG